MKRFAARRSLLLGVTCVVALAILGMNVVHSATLHSSGYISGWTLAGLIVFLASYHIRKAIPVLPLGTSSTWLQAHIYCGYLTFVLFTIHVRFSIPNGVFETLLAVIYLAVFFSGCVGLAITRRYPKRLTVTGQEVFFEEIPVVRRQIRLRVESLVLQCSEKSGASAVSEFYLTRLKPYLEGPRHFWSHLLFQSRRPWHGLATEIRDQQRYLSDGELQLMRDINRQLQKKDELDSQYALQLALKLWLFVHIPLTYALLIFMFFHLILVHAWSGGLS